MNFLNLSKDFSEKFKSKVIIVPILYAGKVCFQEGAFKGANEIIKASYELEYYDCELDVEPYLVGIHTLKETNYLDTKLNYFEAMHEISEKISDELKDKFVIFLGSDHSTTLACVRALDKLDSDFGIIVLDAHSDLRKPWGEDTWHHACVSRYISEQHKTLIIGVRSQDFYENEFLKSKDNKNVDVVYAKEIYSFKKMHIFKKYIKKLPNKIFLSIDVDFFDPCYIKNTNTPEPGGFDWEFIINFFEFIFREKNVIGVDIVEFAPKGELHNYFNEAFFISKLIYKMIAYKFNKNFKVK